MKVLKLSVMCKINIISTIGHEFFRIGACAIEDTFHALGYIGTLPNLTDIVNRWANEEAMFISISVL